MQDKRTIELMKKLYKPNLTDERKALLLDTIAVFIGIYPQDTNNTSNKENK